MHSIDANLLNGHGFIIEGHNKDGHSDIVVANPDRDTPDHEDMLLWSQNPESNFEDIENLWEKENTSWRGLVRKSNHKSIVQ